MHAITDPQPLIDLTNATADYESAYRARHGKLSDEPLDPSRTADAMWEANRRGNAAFDRLAEAVGHDLASQLRVALIFASSRTQGERKVYDTGASTERAVRRHWEYA